MDYSYPAAETCKSVLNPPIPKQRASFYNRTRKLLTANNYFIDTQIVSGILLIITSVIAIIWATISNSYFDFINFKVGIMLGENLSTLTIQDFVNDILLTLFFFVVGLEIKREILAGELSNKKTAANIVFSAMGGIIAPALIYLSLTHHTALASGWAIPTATDTAFAIGILSMFRHKIPAVLFIYLASLAVVDDIVGIIFIGLFYSENIIVLNLILAFATFLMILTINRLQVHRAWPYLLLGLVFWAFIESAGVHGTIAGIFTALATPARSKIVPEHFLASMRNLLTDIKISAKQEQNLLKDIKQHHNLESLEETIKQATTPLLRWEHKLELPVLLLVLPLFALTNAGIDIDLDLFHDVSNHLLGAAIILSLVIGKPLGIVTFAYISKKLGIGQLPQGIKIHDIIGPALLAGMGFTMSLFITDLNFENDFLHLEIAKLAIVISSITSALLGVFWLWRYKMNDRD